jgi:acetyltransferase-like isoleucine patch superfamily enzyme
VLYTLDLARLRAACRVAALVGEPAIEVVNAALLIRTRRVSHVLSAFGAEIGERARVHGPLCIHNASERGYGNLRLGSRTHIGRNVLLDLTCPIVIGDEATISMGVTILTHADVGARELAKRFPRQECETRIGSGAYIGANALILAGCHVGQRAIVGAGAVVTAPIRDDTVAVGVPSKVLRVTGRNSDEVRCGDEDRYLSSQGRQPAWGEIA